METSKSYTAPKTSTCTQIRNRKKCQVHKNRVSEAYRDLQAHKDLNVQKIQVPKKTLGSPRKSLFVDLNNYAPTKVID